MKISLIHPSRGRAQKAKETYDYWMQQSSGKVDIEHILSLDFSDPENEEYGMINEEFKSFGNNSKITIDHNDCVVEATNQAAKISTGDILIYLSDDFKCPKDWDLFLIDVFEVFTDKPILMKVDDCLQKFEVAVLTIPIMNKKLYEKLGYFWHPLYRSMFVDEDLYWTCRNNGWLMYAPDLKFPHEHHTLGLCENDNTYKASEANWNSGKEVFSKRKLGGFPL